MIDFGVIVAATKTAKKVQQFVEGDLLTILSAIADNEYQAARDVLANLHLAKDKKSQMWQVVGHLQSAHTAYWNVYGVSKGFKDYFILTKREAAVRKDIFTLSLIAICYKYLGETDLMKSALRMALAGLDEWKGIDTVTVGELFTDAKKRKNVFSIPFTWANFGSWGSIVDGALHGIPTVNEEQILQLCEYLKYRPALNA